MDLVAVMVVAATTVVVRLLDLMILMLRGMDRSMSRRGGVVRDMMTVPLGDLRNHRDLGERSMVGIIGERLGLF